MSKSADESRPNSESLKKVARIPQKSRHIPSKKSPEDFPVQIGGPDLESLKKVATLPAEAEPAPFAPALDAVNQDHIIADSVQKKKTIH